MAKKIKISQLPDATDLNNLYIFGKGPGTQNVKAPMSLLRGNTAFYEWQQRNPGKTYEDWIKLLQEPAQIAADGIQYIKDDLVGFGAKAKADEAGRVENEKIRKTNESGRILGENQRIGAEIIRGEAEEERLMAETEREESETGRKALESEREEAETGRKRSETIREQNEELRVTEESKRGEAETIRAGAEILRNQSETARAIAEGLRDQAETVREASELDRTGEETGRNAAELRRISAEAEREESEAERKEAEEIRHRAEELRLGNEETRQTNTAKAITNAERSTARANSAAAKGEKLNAHQPIQQVNGEGVLTWWAWNLATDEYMDTTLPARGPQGKGPVVLPNGNYGNWDEELRQYVNSGIEAAATIDLENLPVQFAEAEERETIESGETVPTVFGKIKRWLSDLGALAWKSRVDYTADIDNTPEIPEQIQSDYLQEDETAKDFIKNKPFIPSKTSHITNDTDFQTGSQVQNTVGMHNVSETSHEDIRGKLSGVEAIARGKARARVFDTVEDLDVWLSDLENVKTLQKGDNFYIKAIEVPDYWWDGEQKQQLETEKPDLSVFYTKEESDIKFSKKPVQKTIVLLPDKWKNKILWTHTIEDADVVEGCFLEAWPLDRDSREIASLVDIDENITVSNGEFDLTAVKKPSEAINIVYTIIQ